MCIVKRAIIAVFCVVVMCVSAANASEVSRISTNPKILTALKLLEQNGSSQVIKTLLRENSSKAVIKIQFYDLSLISYSYRNHYAVASDGSDGNNYILINSKFKNSPAEALACLIAHESIHQLTQATFDEEVQATSTETLTWIRLRDNMDTLPADDALVNRLNRLADAYSGGRNQNGIAQLVASNNFYKEQFQLR